MVTVSKIRTRLQQSSWLHRLHCSLSLAVMLSWLGCLDVSASEDGRFDRAGSMLAQLPKIFVDNAFRDREPVIALGVSWMPELEAILPQVELARAVVLNGRSFVRGKIFDHEVVLYLWGPSMTQCAITTQQALSHFNVRALIGYGVAGGVNPDRRPGDVVIVDRSAEYLEMLAAREVNGGHWAASWFELGDDGFDFLFPQAGRTVSRGNDPDEERTYRWFPADPQLLKLAERAGAQVTLATTGRDLEGNPVSLSHQPKVVTGSVVHGTFYVDNERFREWIFRTFAAEAVAKGDIYQTAFVNAVPAIKLRSVSDLAGGGKGENEVFIFFQVAAANAAAIALEMLRLIDLGDFPAPH